MRFFFLVLVIFLPIAASACELGIYTDDSVVAHGGLGPQIFPQFEKLTGCKVRVVAAPDAVQVLGRVEIDLKRGKPAADVILGADTLNWERLQKITERDVSVDPSVAENFVPLVSQSLSKFPGLVPYDFGALTFLADSQELARAGVSFPKSLQDLLQPEWNKNFVLEDPRTSSPGLQLLLFSEKVLGVGFAPYWKALRGQWLAVPPSWSAAYGMFVQGKVPLVWSYVTSEAYHREHGSTRYRAVLLKEGQPVQIEGALIVRGAANPELARRFLNFLVSQPVQDLVGSTNWMWPVLSGAKVPASFSQLPKLEHPVVLDGANMGSVLKEWSKAIRE